MASFEDFSWHSASQATRSDFAYRYLPRMQEYLGPVPSRRMTPISLYSNLKNSAASSAVRISLSMFPDALFFFASIMLVGVLLSELNDDSAYERILLTTIKKASLCSGTPALARSTSFVPRISICCEDNQRLSVSKERELRRVCFGSCGGIVAFAEILWF